MARPALELGSAGWDDFLRIFGLPAQLLSGADHSVFHLLFARLDDECVATAMAFDHEGDCGIYNVGDAGARSAARSGHRADRRSSCTTPLHADVATASVQSTEMAERVYAAVGFRDLGLILEYVP